MKKLTRMKLINWHRFTNVTIDFEKTTLLSGENGAGKSTLLDAIQFVVICSAAHFNKAAHENGKRKLTGYIRCKTGKEGRLYERNGEITAHVALEFYEESRDRYFVVGAVVDSASEGQEKTARYLLDNQRLQEDLFFDGRTPLSISRFRNAHANRIRTWCTTEKDARAMVKNRFGRIDEKFFRLIPKALAFRPIDDIKDFVYSYVLDEKEVNIDVLRENVRTYQDLQRVLQSVRQRIDKLEQIRSVHEKILDCLRKDQMYDYYLIRAEADLLLEEKRRLEQETTKIAEQLKEMEAQKAARQRERAEKNRIRDDLRTELAGNRDFIALDQQESLLRRLLMQKDALKERSQELENNAGGARMQAGELFKRDSQELLRLYEKSLSEINRLESVADLKELARSVANYKREKRQEVQQEILAKRMQLDEVNGELRETAHRIENLKRKKFSYAPGVERLVEAIRSDLMRIGQNSEPRILCELLEITDDSWRNAVEGYLNTQRFYVLVEPEGFDIALGTYDRLRAERKVFGAGLINTRKLREYDEAPDGSLARMVTSKNPYARQYANMVLGRVQCCEDVQELKKHPTSITRDCMRYQNHVASAIRPEVFETPYIGSQAIRTQLQQAESRRDDLLKTQEELSSLLQKQEEHLLYLNEEYDTALVYSLDVLEEQRILQEEIRVCRDSIETLKENSNVMQKQIELSALEAHLRQLDQELEALNRQIGSFAQRMDSCRQRAAEKESLWEKVCEESQMLWINSDGMGEEWEKDYLRLTKKRTAEAFRINYERTKKGNLTILEQEKSLLTEAMGEYKTRHNFGAAANLEGYPAFETEYDKLKNSELLLYQEKVESARQAAEEEFREQFLSKLQENIKTAHGEFRELNRALKDIHFSNEQYEFIFTPHKLYRHYYDMIMDDFNIIQGQSLLSGSFHETHREVIDELFEKLSLDQENEVKALEEFTDYRTYMDYDIRILHSDGYHSYYSKVCEEKSGGETQTPFYVTVAASFVQLYKNNIGGEAVGLVLFDEAFNNMDDERIGGVLEFMGRLDLQILIASPPDKIQYISPYIDSTLLVMTDEKVSFVERYAHERL